MEEELEVILRAVDEASDTFESVTEAAENMGESVQGGAEAGSQGLDEMEESGEAAADPLEQISSIMSGFVGAEVFSQLADTLWDFADKAGTFEDSLMRARLEAEGAGISVNEMTDTVSELSRVTGRAGGEIRESFIKATARGITDMDSFKKMMVGAGAQATLLGTDIQSMGDKFSSMAMRSTLMERQLASTGITMEELATAMGMTGATADEVKDKWEELDTNQRAATLGMAASMNEGQTANEEYKKSWAGLQDQIDIAKGRIERLAGEVLLPVLIPALEVAARVLDWLGDQIDNLINGPFGDLVSVIGTAAAAFALAVPAFVAITGAIKLIELTAIPAALALWEMVAPLLPFIILGAAIAYVVYEIGKAFGWWDDVGSMMDAIWAGVQRLWSAFINHPDVQGFIQGVSDAWDAMKPFLDTTIRLILRFFNVSGKKDFDIVRTLIDTISKAWAAMTLPIKTVIEVIKTLWNAFSTMYQKCKTALDNAKKAFDKFKEKVQNIVRDVIKEVSKITGIDISGVVSKIVKPFKDAYDGVAKQVEKIKKKAKEIPSNVGRGGLGVLGGFSGGEDLNFYGGSDLTSYSTEKLSVDMNQNINLSLDLRNVPSSMDERQLAGLINETLDSKEFINRLVNNPDFQSLDSKVKQRIVLKSNRANGRGV